MSITCYLKPWIELYASQHSAIAGAHVQASSYCASMQGVLHCGGVLEDAVLGAQTLGSLRRVAAPKTCSALLWHGLLKAQPLGHQVRLPRFKLKVLVLRKEECKSFIGLYASFVLHKHAPISSFSWLPC